MWVQTGSSSDSETSIYKCRDSKGRKFGHEKQERVEVGHGSTAFLGRHSFHHDVHALIKIEETTAEAKIRKIVLSFIWDARNKLWFILTPMSDLSSPKRKRRKRARQERRVRRSFEWNRDSAFRVTSFMCSSRRWLHYRTFSSFPNIRWMEMASCSRFVFWRSNRGSKVRKHVKNVSSDISS